MRPLTETLSVHTGHPDVCDHNVGLVFAEEFEAPLTVIRSDDGEASFLEFQFKETSDVSFIVDDQDFFLSLQGDLLPRS